MIDLSLDSRLFLGDEVDFGLQELDILLNTENTELIGNHQYGCNFYQFLWQLNPSVESIKTYIIEKINTTMYLSKFNTEVDVNIVNGTLRDIYYVRVIVYLDNTKTNIKYREYEFR